MELSVTLPRRDKHGAKIGELKAETLSGDQLESGGILFSQTRTIGINLLKIHGSLDVFTFRDGKDLLRILPIEQSVSGVVEALRAANEELVYMHPAAPDRPAKGTNEIVYADDEGEMQFLRRTLLAGAFKFDSRRRQVLPLRLLDYFRARINHVSTLICIGYGFGDAHINQVIREWLEFDAGRKLEVVGPGIKHIGDIPAFPLHLASQVVLRDSTATEYFDFVSGIVRSKRDGLEKRLSAYVRRNGIKAQTELQEFMKQRGDRLTAAFVEKVASLPIREGVLELNSLGMTPEELVHRWKIELVGTTDDSLDAFLKSKDA